MDTQIEEVKQKIREAEKQIEDVEGDLRGRCHKLAEKGAVVEKEGAFEERELSSDVLEKLLQELGEFMAESQTGLKMVFKDIDSKPKRLSDLPAFSWDDRLERSQADKYIAHLNKIVSGRKWKLIDAANNYPALLSGFFGGWNFKGTTDVAFVHREVAKIEPCRGWRCIFELKKDCRLKEDGGQGDLEKAVNQTKIQLVMANVFAQQFRPCAVLTDLDDFWSLYWMDGSTIYWYTFESRASAVGYIEELLQDSDDNEMGTSEAPARYARPHGENEDLVFIKKRRMYEPPEMDNLKDLVGLIPDEEILSARAQFAVQQLQKLLHIPMFFGVPDVDVPRPSNMYC